MSSDFLTEKEKEYREAFLKARKLAIAAIKSSKKMYELINLSTQCEEKLEKEFSELLEKSEKTDSPSEEEPF